MMGLLCLATGALLDAATGPCVSKGSDDQSLLRALLDRLQSEDIMVGDVFYPIYFLLCGLRPGRSEPRALKRRQKSYPLLTKPRRVAQEVIRKDTSQRGGSGHRGHRG